MAVLTASSSQCLTTIFAFALAFAFHISSPPGLAEATNSGGFSLELIHRDSPKSPLYNASETPSQRMDNSLLRSLRRAESFGGNPRNLFDFNIPGERGYYQTGEFLVKVGFGTPPLETFLIFDTGSNLVWTQCKACTHCMPLDTPAYNPDFSSTRDGLACDTHSCHFLENTCVDGTCQYTYYYDGGSSYTKGVLITEYLRATSFGGGEIEFPNLRLGCGYDNELHFSGKVSGVLGMGNGFISLARQNQYRTGPKFSYCFHKSRDVPGRLTFGDSSWSPGPTVVSTPLILDESDSVYRFTMTAISVGSTRIEFGRYATFGNMVVDSSIVSTLVPIPVYSSLANAVTKSINATEADPPFGKRSEHLCYWDSVDLPDTPVTMHFLGSDLTMKLSDMFMKNSERKMCFTIGPTLNKTIFFYGSWAQSNFQVGFDLDAQTLSFMPSDCAGP